MRSPPHLSPMQHQHQQTRRPVLALCFGAAAGALQRPFLSASPATVYYEHRADAAFSNC